MSIRANRESGLSLVDVLMSMFLLTIALVGLTLALPPAYLSVFQERTVTHGVTLAQRQIEIARRTAVDAVGYASLSSLTGTDSTTYSPYTMTTTVTADAPATNFTTVNVSVTGPPIVGPQTPNMGPQNVVLETFIADPAP
jgi:Tfp pilus assembly protein PilV